MNRRLYQYIAQVEDLITKSSAASNEDLELQAHWARYLCVLVAGLLENALQEIYSDFARSKASEQVANYAVSQLSKLQNPNGQKFIDVARQFDRSWGDKIEFFLASDGRKDKIDSVINLRHQIAHGKSTGITLARLKEYFHCAKDVIEFIRREHC